MDGDNNGEEEGNDKEEEEDDKEEEDDDEEEEKDYEEEEEEMLGLTRWQILKKSCLKNSDEWVRFDEDMSNTLRAADAMIDDKKKALHAAPEKEKFLRAEYKRMGTENELLLIRQSEKVEMHLKIAEQLDGELQSTVANRDKLVTQLNESKLKRKIEKEEYEKLLDEANQRHLAVLEKYKMRHRFFLKHNHTLSLTANKRL